MQKVPNWINSHGNTYNSHGIKTKRVDFPPVHKFVMIKKANHHKFVNRWKINQFGHYSMGMICIPVGIDPVWYFLCAKPIVLVVFACKNYQIGCFPVGKLTFPYVSPMGNQPFWLKELSCPPTMINGSSLTS